MRAVFASTFGGPPSRGRRSSSGFCQARAQRSSWLRWRRLVAGPGRGEDLRACAARERRRHGPARPAARHRDLPRSTDRRARPPLHEDGRVRRVAIAHIGQDFPGDEVERGWEFLRPYLQDARRSRSSPGLRMPHRGWGATGQSCSRPTSIHSPPRTSKARRRDRPSHPSRRWG